MSKKKRKHAKRIKIREKDIVRFLRFLHRAIGWITITDDEDLPALRGARVRTVAETSGDGEQVSAVQLPPSIARALRVADEFTSGVNADVSRLRDAVQSALAAVDGKSLSPCPANLDSAMSRAQDHDLGFTMAANEGYDGPVPATVQHPDEFEEGRRKGLERWVAGSEAPEWDGQAPSADESSGSESDGATAAALSAESGPFGQSDSDG